MMVTYGNPFEALFALQRALDARLATSRRKIEISGIVLDGRADKARRDDRRDRLNSDCGCSG